MVRYYLRSHVGVSVLPVIGGLFSMLAGLRPDGISGAADGSEPQRDSLASQAQNGKTIYLQANRGFDQLRVFLMIGDNIIRLLT